ncbi:release factor glutamine methyltransferase [Croceivirga lutea]|uniref:peptide chain release factor N(5)-glutamine methyltransferase n=1 Tax=Croceivirga lutea TaxID=1775167 RepID=UPI00163A93C9|nr:peptide chain release factor N(5)-glutamine methyltransferase [Croceivirga lutea]GGG46992.1 release factor glutamine methyltransferase [Croceivirga lutea]
MYLKEIKSIFKKELQSLYPKEEIDSFFFLLIEHYLGLQRFILVVQPELVITKEEEQPLFEALSRLKNQEPVQYIIGETFFKELRFKVNQHTLIPRPETEELVNWILNDLSDTPKKTRLLDIGTGSGCIAISLAHYLPQANVSAVDISKKALHIAQENATHNGVEINFFQQDILTAKQADYSYDIIVSNPPYVRELEKAEMHKNVLQYEPESALFVSDKNPLLFYEAIVEFATKNLAEGGSLYFEINQYLPEVTKQLLLTKGFTQVELRKDILGNFRMLKAMR